MRLRGQSDSVGPSEKAILSPPKGKAGKTNRAKTPTSKSMLDKAKNVSKATSSQPSLTTPGPVTTTATEITAAAGGSVGTKLRASEECQEQTASATTTPSRPRPPVRGQDQPAVTTSVSTRPSRLDTSSDTSPRSKSRQVLTNIIKL